MLTHLTVEGVRFALIKEHDMWSAQGVELDIGASAPTLDDLYKRLGATIEAEQAEATRRGVEIPRTPPELRAKLA